MRDHRIDILRFVGLAMIILAHVNPPPLLFQLRNFDVPLMVLVSGMSFGLSFALTESYPSYVWKRIKRLLFPVWKFLTVYFVALLVLAPWHRDLQPLTVLSSYALIDGIGYVWVIRVFLLVALIAPLIFYFNGKVKSNRRYLLGLAALFALYEAFRYLSLPDIHSGLGESASLVVHYLVPYALVFALGLRLITLTRSEVVGVLAVSLAVLALFAVSLYLSLGEWVPTQKYKYPPSCYYFAYAILVSCVLWMLSTYLDKAMATLRLKELVLFIAQNSIWIYLWHIPFVKFMDAQFVPKYLVVFSVAVAITYCQVWIVENVVLERVSSQRSRKNIRMMLTG